MCQQCTGVCALVHILVTDCRRAGRPPRGAAPGLCSAVGKSVTHKRCLPSSLAALHLPLSSEPQDAAVGVHRRDEVLLRVVDPEQGRHVSAGAASAGTCRCVRSHMPPHRHPTCNHWHQIRKLHCQPPRLAWSPACDGPQPLSCPVCLRKCSPRHPYLTQFCSFAWPGASPGPPGRALVNPFSTNQSLELGPDSYPLSLPPNTVAHKLTLRNVQRAHHARRARPAALSRVCGWQS